MLSRLTVSLAVALLAVYGSTSAAYAAIDEQDEVIILTAGVSAALMAILLIAYGIRHAVGADKMPPPEPEADHAHH
jgi:hypothetical protein